MSSLPCCIEDRSHTALKLLSVCMVSSLPYCMQRSNTEACIHETCNVRTQMHADRNNAKCEHRAYIHDTWNVRAQMHADRKRAMCEHRDAMSVSEPIDSSRLLMFASDVRANAHRRRLQQIKPTSTVFLVKSFRIEWVVVVVVDVVVAVVAPNLYLITSPLLAIYGS